MPEKALVQRVHRTDDHTSMIDTAEPTWRPLVIRTKAVSARSAVHEHLEQQTGD